MEFQWQTLGPRFVPAQQPGSDAAGPRSLARAERGGRQQRRRQQERPAGGCPLPGALAAAARVPLALQLLAQNARVGRRALAPHVVDAGSAVLAMQELVVTHVCCKTAGEGGKETYNK